MFWNDLYPLQEHGARVRTPLIISNLCRHRLQGYRRGVGQKADFDSEYVVLGGRSC